MGSNAIAVYEKVTDPVSFCNEMALTMTALTNCSVEQGKAIALTCLCEGMTPLDFVRRYHLIDGKPSMRADSMLAEFRMNHGGNHKVIDASGDRACVKLTDSLGNETQWAITWEEAQQEAWPWASKNPETQKRVKKGEVLKTNWATPRARANMLWARAVSEGLRRVCPELVAGVYTPEEMEDTIADIELRPVATKPVTATEILQQQSEQQAKQQEAAKPEAAKVDDSEAIDASFEVINGATTEPSPAVLDAIRSLYDEMDVPQEKQAAALTKRGVTMLCQLSKDQANELHVKLIGAKRARDSAKN